MSALHYVENPRFALEFGASDLPPDRARSNLEPRIVPKPFAFSAVVSGHHIKLAVDLGEPDWSRDLHAIFSKRRQVHVVLIVNFGRNGCHIIRF